MKTPNLSIEKMIHIINYEFSLRRRKHPEGFCYVCSRLDPEGKYPANPHKHLFERGYFQRCPHAPRAPHPSLADFDSGVLASDDELFDTDVLNKDKNLPNVLKKRDRKQFKIPPTFEKQARSTDGSLLPLISERTFASVQFGKRKEKKTNAELSALSSELPALSPELPPLSPGRRDLVVKGDEQRRRARFSRPGHSKRSQNVSDPIGSDVEENRGRSLDVHLPSEFDSWVEDSDPKATNLKYHHRNKSGKFNLPANTNDWYADSGTPLGNRKSRHKRTTGSRDANKEGSYSITPSGSCSLSRASTLTTPSPSQDFMMTLMKSSTWCECPDVNTDQLRCTECYCTGRHEKWCISKVQVCPNCGKAVKIKHDHSHKKMSKDKSSSVQSTEDRPKDVGETHKTKTETGSADEKGNVRKVKFAEELNETVSIPGGEHSAIVEVEKGDNSRSNKKTSRPVISPNIHKRAYLLALSDSIVNKLRRNPELFYRRGKGTYFSYFPLYKHKNYNPPAKSSIGISPRDEGPKKKVKKGLTHILGDIKIADYYPGGKKYVPETTDTAHD